MRCGNCFTHLDEMVHDDFCPNCHMFLRMCLRCGTTSVIPKSKHIAEIIGEAEYK